MLAVLHLRILIVVIILSSLTASLVYSQSIIPDTTINIRDRAMPSRVSVLESMQTTPYFGVGAQIGLSTGLGISTRYTNPQRFAVEATFFYMSIGVERAFYSFGGEMQYQFDNSLDSRFYGLAGLSYYADDKSDSLGNNVLIGPFRLGFGLGYEWSLSPKVALNVEGILTVFTGGSRTEVLPLPQAGLIYYFR